MRKSEMLQKIVESLQATDEGAFQYFDLAEGYDVTLNFIAAGSHLPKHTHDQTVFNYVMEGEFEVSTVNGTKSYRKGEWLYIPASQEHSVTAKVETVLLELWKK